MSNTMTDQQVMILEETAVSEKVKAPLGVSDLLSELGRASSDKEPRDLRHDPRARQIGSCIRQGDVYLIRIHDNKPTTIENKEGTFRVTIDPSQYTQEAATNQLVDGFTLGSRHVVTNVGPNVKMLVNPKESNSLLGPMIKAKGDVVVGHPEHAEFRHPRGTYITVGQLNVQTLERIAD